MSNENFTPGEWEVQEFYYENGKRTVYEIVYNEDGDRVSEGVDNKADAYLMAASKAMYEALEDVCSECEKHSNWEDLFNIGRPAGTQMPPCPCDDCYVKKALKKARGEE